MFGVFFLLVFLRFLLMFVVPCLVSLLTLAPQNYFIKILRVSSGAALSKLRYYSV